MEAVLDHRPGGHALQAHVVQRVDLAVRDVSQQLQGPLVDIIPGVDVGSVLQEGLDDLVPEVGQDGGRVQRGVRGQALGVDLGAALDKQPGDLDAGEEVELALLEHVVLALEHVVLHHAQVEQRLARRCPRVDHVHDVVDPPPDLHQAGLGGGHGVVVVVVLHRGLGRVVRLQVSHQLQEMCYDAQDFVIGFLKITKKKLVKIKLLKKYGK